MLEAIKQLPPEEIMSKAYEITIKADILMCFEGDLDEKDAQALLNLDTPLNDIYNDWMNVDSSWHMDTLRECIDTVAAEALEEVGKEYVGKYEIIGKTEVGRMVFVLGLNPDAEKSYGVWQGHLSNPGSYTWGSHYGTFKEAQTEMQRRADKKQQSLDTPPHGGGR